VTTAANTASTLADIADQSAATPGGRR
jgi:hypothetical protein